MALFGLASIPLAFERVAALPAPQPQQLVEATLGFLTCGSDPGRKNATMFLAATLHFRVILDEFDAQVGLPCVAAPTSADLTHRILARLGCWGATCTPLMKLADCNLVMYRSRFLPAQRGAVQSGSCVGNILLQADPPPTQAPTLNLKRKHTPCAGA